MWRERRLVWRERRGREGWYVGKRGAGVQVRKVGEEGRGKIGVEV